MTCNCRKKISEMITCRRILYVMVVSGFILNAALKTIFNITIVAMVKSENETDTDKFDWNENQKQDILGVFFWGFAITKIPSGRLAEMVGSRRVTGYSMVLASLLTLVSPVIASLNYYLLLGSRVVMGLLIGASWPAIMPLGAKWVPPKEYSVFIACLSSTGVGAAVSFQLCGVLIGSWGWQSVFYVIGSAALVWSAAWFYLIYDSPDQHPRISLKERYSLDKEIEKTGKTNRVKFSEVPWLQIVKSKAVWAILAGQVATFFAYATLCNELPSYLDQVLHFNIEQNGVFSGLPHYGGYVAALISGYVADNLRKSGKLSVTAIRKLFETISLSIPSLCMLVLAFWGNISPVALTAFTISMTTNAIGSAGHCANILDISRNYSGTICGIVNTISAISVYFSTQMVAALLENGHTFYEWRYLFWILFGLYVTANIVYLILCSGELQSWDSLKKREDVKDEKEMRLMDEKSAA